VARIVEAAVGHDAPCAAVGFAPVRIHPSMARYQGLHEAGRDRGRKLAGLGKAEEMLEPGGCDGYMVYETMFSK
jgi:hypothetical protein